MNFPTSLPLGQRTVSLGWCSVEGVTAEALTVAERPLYERGKTPKRRAEFCAGRSAARLAVAGLEPQLTRFDVLALTSGLDAGRPVLHPPSDIALSISHAGNWAVAGAARGEPLGLDFEHLPLEVSSAFANEAFSPGELEVWASQTADAVPVAWAAKEAALKWLGVGLRAALQRVRVTPHQLTWRQGVCTLRVSLEVGGAWPSAPEARLEAPGTLAVLPVGVLFLVG